MAQAAADVCGAGDGEYPTKHHESRCKFCPVQLALRKHKNVGSNPGDALLNLSQLAVQTIKEKILGRYSGRLENAMNIIKGKP
jgi:hypothetical protein